VDEMTGGGVADNVPAFLAEKANREDRINRQLLIDGDRVGGDGGATARAITGSGAEHALLVSPGGAR
jgi:hypothetical protein